MTELYASGQCHIRINSRNINTDDFKFGDKRIYELIGIKDNSSYFSQEQYIEKSQPEILTADENADFNSYISQNPNFNKSNRAS